MTIRTIQLQANRLRIGMFVESVRGSLDHAFPASGVLIETEEQCNTIKSMCTLAKIDLSRSSDEVFQLYSTPEASMTLVETPCYNNATRDDSNDHQILNTPQFDQNLDKYGYQGRLIYRVLEERFVAMTEEAPVDMKVLDRELSDFIAYTNIKPDLLSLESYLSTDGDAVIALGMRSLVHICLYARTYGKNDQYIQPIALSMIVYITILHRLPKHIKQLAFQQDLAENSILANAIDRQLKAITQRYNFPLNVKKCLSQLCERYDGNGPTQCTSSKISHQAQLINMAFTFEYLQSAHFQNQPLTATEAISAMRETSGTLFNPQLLEKFVQTLPIYPTGSLVKVNDRLAVVTQQHPLRKLSPKILAVAELNGEALEDAEWITSDVRLGSMKQCTTHITISYDYLVRETLELKMPWYRRLINPDAIRGWFHRIDLPRVFEG